MSEKKTDLVIIKNTANKILPECKVLLFGSRARNEANAHSDYDVMLIVSENIEIHKKMQYKALFRKMMVKYGLIADVFIESEEELQEKSAFLGHIVRTAVKEGIYL